MSFFEQIFDLLGVIFGGIFGSVERAITAIFGSANARQVAKYHERAELITALEPKYQSLSDEQLRHQTVLLRQRLRDGETLDEILNDAFAVCRERQQTPRRHAAL